MNNKRKIKKILEFEITNGDVNSWPKSKDVVDSLNSIVSKLNEIIDYLNKTN